MASFGSRRGEAGALSLYLMAGAFLSAGALMAWLFVRAAPVEVEVVEGGEVREEMASAPVVDNGVFGGNPMAHEDMRVRLNGLLVINVLGPQAFQIEVPNQANPYLVGMLPDALRDDEVVEYQSTVSLIGSVHVMSDSVADAWVASGAIPEGQRIIAIFAESFFEAEEVDVTGQAEPDAN
jgi:hypothetical protein